MWRVKWLVLWSLWAARLARQPTSPLRVSGGWLRGAVVHTGSHVAYLAIPYATVTQRFQAPGPEPTWDGVFDAVNENIRCPQDLIVGLAVAMGKEDCLTLNVYTPLNASPTESLPVMVNIHGGGFFEGSGSPAVYGPDYLIKKNVILVTMNYRLSIQGFLCLGIAEAPGNVGLKDQVAALKWVRRNIKAFGGDPDNVTIFGVSAGAASVSYHILSPMSKGLFHKAIVQSGSSLASWAFQYDPIHAAGLKAKLWGFDSQDPLELYNFFKGLQDAEFLTKVVPREEGNLVLSQLIFVPCVEKKIDGVEPFLTETPFEILSNGSFNKVPIMIGSNTQEGLLFANHEKDDYLPRIDIEISLPKDLDISNNVERKQLADRVKELYMGDSEISVGNLDKLAEFVGDAFFNYPAVVETKLITQSNDQPVYSYLFSYDGQRNLLKSLMRNELRDVPGAGHADELFYLFSQYGLRTMSEDEMIDKMTTMWTNFAMFGNPTPSQTDLLPVRWPRMTEDAQETLRIDKDFSLGPLLDKLALEFWDGVYSKYRKK